MRLIFRWALNAFDHVYTIFAVRVLWRSRHVRAEAIRGFQAVEADGVWHLYQAIPRIEDDQIRAQTFSHLIEEESHADAFARAYEQESGTYFRKKYMERRRLFDESAPLWNTLAYVHVGEVDATRRFQRILTHLESGPLKSAMGRIVADELGHVDLTEQELIKLGVPEKDVKDRIFRIRWQRFAEVWLNMGRSGGEKFSNVLLSLVYFTILPIAVITSKKRMASRTVTYDNNHLKDFR